MQIGSSYFIPVCVVILITSILAISKILKVEQSKLNKVINIFSTLFSFGLVFAGACSIQGALLNPSSSVDLNGFFYILGIFIYIAFVAATTYQVIEDYKTNFWKIRIIFKATLLSFGHISPVPFVFSVVFIDLTLMALNFYLS